MGITREFYGEKKGVSPGWSIPKRLHIGGTGALSDGREKELLMITSKGLIS